MKDLLQKQIDESNSDLSDAKNRMGLIEESLNNSKKSVNGMGKKVM
jgi:hypothetical protein